MQSISYPITWQIILTIRSISTPDLKYFLGAMLLSTSTCPAYWTSLRTLSAGLRSSAILMFWYLLYSRSLFILLILHKCRTSWRGQTRVGLLLKIIVLGRGGGLCIWIDRLYAYTSSEMSDIILHASKTNTKSTLLFCFFVFFAL